MPSLGVLLGGQCNMGIHGVLLQPLFRWPGPTKSRLPISDDRLLSTCINNMLTGNRSYYVGVNGCVWATSEI